MPAFSLFGKLTAQPGQGPALATLLLEAAAMVRDVPGCDLYIINTSASDPDGVWVYEQWRSQADHDASLTLESVRAVIRRAMPLLAGPVEGLALEPIGGKGAS